MVRRSQLMALAVAFVVAAALHPATARAADGCLANPTGAARAGQHWYYQTNDETQQRCWFLVRKTVVKKPALQSALASMDRPPQARPVASVSCAAAPGSPVKGRRWSYQTDPTGQKCWRLSNRTSRSLRTLPSPMLLAAAGEPSAALPQPIADAQASVQQDVPVKIESPAVAAASPVEVTATEPGLVEPPTPDDATPTFASRWSDDFKVAAADPLTNWSRDPASRPRPVQLAARSSFKDAELVLAAGPPLIDVVVVAVATLGSVFLLLGLFDWSLLFSRSAAAAREPRVPLQLPTLDVETDSISALRPDHDDMLSLFAPTAAATRFGFAPRFMIETV